MTKQNPALRSSLPIRSGFCAPPPRAAPRVRSFIDRGARAPASFIHGGAREARCHSNRPGSRGVGSAPRASPARRAHAQRSCGSAESPAGVPGWGLWRFSSRRGPGEPLWGVSLFVGLQGKTPPTHPSPPPQRSGRHVGVGGPTHSHTARAAPSRGFAFAGRDGRVRVNPQLCAGFCVALLGHRAGRDRGSAGFGVARSSGLWGEMGPGRAPRPPPVHPRSSCCGYQGCAPRPRVGSALCMATFE